MRRRDGGQVTAFAVLLVLMLAVMAGLVLDGGRLFTARRSARNVAAAAARAGAQGLSEQALRDPTRDPTLDPVAARNLAESFLAAEGITGAVVVDDTYVTVSVVIKVAPVILGVVGVGEQQIAATESARIEGGP